MSTNHAPVETGFSLVELIATLTVIAILAVFAIPRLMDRTAFDSRGFYDQAQAIVRYAQKVAVAQRQSTPKGPVYVIVSATQIAVCYDAACVSPVADPATGSALVATAPPGVALAPTTTFTFSGSGAPSVGAQLAITVASSGVGDINRVFYVEPAIGYVHD
jgi:MSHA pilin protein MshC